MDRTVTETGYNGELRNPSPQVAGETKVVQLAGKARRPKKLSPNTVLPPPVSKRKITWEPAQ